MRKLLLGLGFLISLLTTAKAQVYSDTLFFATACPSGTGCTGEVMNPQNVADSSQANYATLLNGLGLGSSVVLEFGFSTPAQAGSLVGVTLQKGNQTLSAGLLSNITVQLYSSSGTLVTQKNGLQLEDLGLLSGPGSSPAYVVTFFTGAGTYDISRVRVTLGGVLNVLNDIRVYNAFYLSPATNGSGQVCGLEYATNLVNSGCSGLLCSVVTPELAVDTLNYDDYGVLNIPVGLLGILGNAQMRVGWDTPGDSGQFVGFIIGQNNLVLNLALLGNINVTLHDSAGNVVHTHGGFSTVDLTLLSGSSDKSIVGFYAPVDFASAQIQLVQLVGLLTSVRVYGAVKFDATPDVVQISTSPFTNLCSGDSVILTASPGYDQYFWSTGEIGPSITVSQSGTYTLTALDNDACLYYSTVQPITINNLPAQPIMANVNANPTILCNGATTVISVVSPFPPTWSTGDTTTSITVQNSGTYTVSVTDTNGCVSTSDSLTVITDTALVNITSTDSVSCEGVSLTLVADGTHNVTWSTGFVGDTLMVNPTVNTTYTASVISTYGCVDSSSLAIQINPLPPQPTISGLPSDSITLCNGATQVLTITPSSGTYTPVWSEGTVGNSITVSLAGDYYVTVIDSNGCMRASDTVAVLTDTALVNIATASGDTATCFSESIAITLIATANGGVVWSTGDTTSTIQVMPLGTAVYTATVTTALGCSNTDVFTLTVNPLPPPPTIDGITPPGADTLALCNGATATLTVNSLFASPLWSTGDTTASITIGNTGTYYVTIEDPNGCTATSDTLTAIAETAQVDLVSADTAACGGNPITIVVTANGTVTWNDGSVGTAFFDTPTTTTTYTATVTTPLNCQDQVVVTVTVSDTSGYATAQGETVQTLEDEPVSPVDVGVNDVTSGSGSWAILSGPFSGTANINGSNISYTPNTNFVGTDSIIYVVCGSNSCGTACDTAVMEIRVIKDPNSNLPPEVKIPGGISPNGDGTNDGWVIEGLGNYPENKLTILNRWGDILYQAAPYNNDWKGTTNKGLTPNSGSLPDGTYYYVLILEQGQKPVRGFIEVRK